MQISFPPSARATNISTKSSSPSPPTHRPTRTKQRDLEEQLYAALVRSPLNPSNSFLPRDDLQSILNKDSIKQFLGSRSEHHPTRVLQICDYICGTGALKIFAILLLINKSESIYDFFLEDVHDEDLPFTRRRQGGGRFHLSLKRSDSDHPLKSSENWEALHIDLFDEYQWRVLTPCFHYDSGSIPLFYHLNERTVLPWMESSLVAEGGFARIFRVRIHPAHHNFHHISVRSFKPLLNAVTLTFNSLPVSSQLKKPGTESCKSSETSSKH